MQNFDNIRQIGFVGVGGVSMRALAQFCLDEGKSVLGWDDSPDADLSDLIDQGMRVVTPADLSVWSGCDLSVYTAAVSPDHPVRVYAKTHALECVERKEFLAAAASLFQRVIAVAGSHGKTTVTAMIAHILSECDADFAAHIGGDAAMGRNHWLGGGRNLFVTEACEYNRSFLELHPDYGVVLNCDYDHPDTYPTAQDSLEAFRQFARQSRIVVSPVSCPIPKNSATLTYGIGCGDYNARCVRRGKKGIEYDWYREQTFLGTVCLSIDGIHNVLNALAACCVCRCNGILPRQCMDALTSFHGVARRFQDVGYTDRGARVVCDYAHHPKEIACAIDCARGQSNGKIVVVFEPHTYSRTQRLKDAFADSFYWADELAILPTFAARETPEDGMDGKQFADYLSRRSIPPVWLENERKTADFLKYAAGKGDIVLMLGAGTIDRLAAKLVSTSPQS